MVWLEWTLVADVQVLGLRRGHLAQTDTQVFEMSSGNFLIELDNKRVDVKREREAEHINRPSSEGCRHRWGTVPSW